MIAKTTEDFLNNEVLPQVEYLENHEFNRSVKLLKQAGELGLTWSRCTRRIWWTWD